MYSSFAKIIYGAGAKVRNPSLWKEYESLKQSEWLSRDKLYALQAENAGAFFKFVSRYSRYYESVFRQAGFDARKISSLDDMQRIPVITKNDLVANREAIQSDYDFSKVFKAETSGTTGGALEFNRDERWDSINRASVMRAYDWYGVKPWDRHGYFWGYNISGKHAVKVKLLDALQNRFRVFNYGREDIADFARKLRSANHVAGYSSMIYEVARIINEMGIEVPSLKLVKGTSEMILDVYHREAKKAFGVKVTSEYGAAESGLIAFECPQGNMHINIENVIVEVDAGGEIIVTNLASYSHPIIRYKLGDVVALSDEYCSCGRSHPIIKDVFGRKGALVYGHNKEYPALTFYYVFKNIAINYSILMNYKVAQYSKGEVTITIEGGENAKHENIVRQELDKYFGADMLYQIAFVKSFDRERKKAQYFESFVSL